LRHLGKMRQPLKTSYFGGFVTHSIFDKKDIMANKVKSLLQIRRILQLLEESRSKRFISREVGVSRNTVDYYEKRVKVSGLTLSQLLLLKDGELSQFIVIAQYPEAFKLSDFDDVIVSSLGHFSVYYKYNLNAIIIMAFWDNRQDTKDLLNHITLSKN